MFLINELDRRDNMPNKLSCTGSLTNYLATKLKGSIIIIDNQGNIVSVSEEFLKLTDQTEFSVLGKNLADFTEEHSSKKALIDKIDSLITHKASRIMFSCLWSTKITKIKLLFELFSPENNNTEIPVFVTKHEEEKPFVAENLDFKQILESLGILVWHSSIDVSDIYYISPGFENYYEIKFKEYLKDPWLLFNRIHPDDRESVLRVYDSAHGLSIWSLGFRYHLNNGSWRHIHIYRFPVYDKSGDVSSIVGVAIDNTPLYQSREEMTLNQKNLATTNSKLIAFNDALMDFTGFACHDLSEPLRSFKIYTEMLEKNYVQNLDEDGQLVLNTIHNATQRMEELITGINKFFLTRKESVETTPLDINELIEKTIKPTYASSLKPTCSIEVSKLHPLRINEKHMITLLQNLISNSIKYNNNFPHIRIRSKEFRDSIVYTIADNGIGIPEKMHEQIFKVGNRVNEKPEQPGAGIGLFACKKVMSFYNGLLWVHSKPGEGSTFYLLFPKEQLID